MSEPVRVAGHDFWTTPSSFTAQKREQTVIEFRRFRVFPCSRQLLLDGREVAVGGRGFDLLVALLEKRGSTVEKAELYEKVWPSRIVEESNLRFQMAMLRQALGADADAIKTVRGRGYMIALDHPMIERQTESEPPLQHDALGEFSMEEWPGEGTVDRIRELERENTALRQALADATIGRLILANISEIRAS